MTKNETNATGDNELPIYNLKAVVQETGLKPDTLRAWERRYGLPEPQRTPSGHRLYTKRDVATLKWLIERQDEGLIISRAVALWHDLSREGADPLERIPLAPQSAGSTGKAAMALPPVVLPVPGQPNALVELKNQWIDACLRFDERSAEQLLHAAFALFAVETVCTDLIQQALADLGHGWYEGRVTVQQEHFASSLAMRRLETLLTATPAPTRGGRILIGCPPHESHTFVPLMLSLFLRRRGWDVVYLGADVPVVSLESTVDAAAPSLVVLSAQQLHTAASLLEMARLLQSKRVPLAYGGLIFNLAPEVRTTIPGHYLGPSLAGAVDRVEELMIAPYARPSARPVSHEYVQALHHFREHRAAIEAEIWHSLEESGVPQANLADANMGLGRGIDAALALGDIQHLSADMEWIRGMLVNHNRLPAEAVDEYVSAYARAAAHYLGEPGRVVVQALTKLAAMPLSTFAPNGNLISSERSKRSAIRSQRRN